MGKYIAIKRLVYSYLVDALSFEALSTGLNDRESGKFPLYQGSDNSRILYISGIALQLSKSHNQPTLEIANHIVSHLLTKGEGAFRLQIVSPGWIHLELTHGFLATWLQSLVVSNVATDKEMGTSKITRQNQSRLFSIQYAHARCYSLLLLAHREGLIKLTEAIAEINDNSGFYQTSFASLLSAEEIPWLNDDQKLRLIHPAEGCLISELVKVVDYLEFADLTARVNWEKFALDLSQAFESFWCQCRIWGKVKISTPELAQARLGLMIVTQSVLRCLLVDKLGAVAPISL
ncbi:glutamate acetyltransferase [Nodularia harveyana UHCC-0300]|uniref:Glutamate acetyltransferase n=1 Tax=Nodularia harveyana UHCC-0300 TaxID=2974287 RepID=A0ABU5UDG8_9CYAN|nr:glutamate acetyltransferase [Nodularia harveyana]MEA5581542.1 glutamate acetyltransferase [Nodularia harveyana UHCC-0300]